MGQSSKAASLVPGIFTLSSAITSSRDWDSGEAAGVSAVFSTCLLSYILSTLSAAAMDTGPKALCYLAPRRLPQTPFEDQVNLVRGWLRGYKLVVWEDRVGLIFICVQLCDLFIFPSLASGILLKPSNFSCDSPETPIWT